jgi:YidC/Oxa1 family membrane protein insertase
MESLFSPFIDLADAIITFLHDDVGLVYGTAIVGLTFITRALILPLSVKQIRSMREMSAIQPLLKEIQEKYKDDRQRMQREQMRLFQEHGVNPLASCFPLLLQLPVFIALFYLLQGDEFQNEAMAAVEESLLVVDDLTENATGSSLIILLILYIATSVIAGLIMTGGRSASAQQRMIALGLPLIFTPIMISFPAGLLVYWVATNIWTMGQQAVVRLFFPPPPQPTPEEVKASRPPPPPPRKRKRRR